MVELIDVILVLSLIGLNVFQLVFWSRQVQQLVDKLMSRNYTDYSVAAKPKEVERRIQVPLAQDLPDDLRILNGFNA